MRCPPARRCRPRHVGSVAVAAAGPGAVAPEATIAPVAGITASRAHASVSAASSGPAHCHVSLERRGYGAGTCVLKRATLADAADAPTGRGPAHAPGTAGAAAAACASRSTAAARAHKGRKPVAANAAGGARSSLTAPFRSPGAPVATPPASAAGTAEGTIGAESSRRDLHVAARHRPAPAQATRRPAGTSAARAAVAAVTAGAARPTGPTRFIVVVAGSPRSGHPGGSAHAAVRALAAAAARIGGPALGDVLSEMRTLERRRTGRVDAAAVRNPTSAAR